MNVEKKYIPKKGDIVWIDFDPAAGKEIQKRRPGLVVSRYEFNRKTMFAVICPITSTIKNIPTRYTLPDDIETQGQVVISQLKSLDFTERKLSQIEHLPLKDMAKIDQIIEYYLLRIFSLKPFTKKLLFMKKKTLKKPLTFLDKGSRIYRAKTI